MQRRGEAPLLDMEQERILIGRWQAERDRTALEALILSHARQVYACAMRLSGDAADREELIAEGMVGLIRAADRFDLSRGVRFSTYAQWWIRNSALRALARLRLRDRRAAAGPARGGDAATDGAGG